MTVDEALRAVHDYHAETEQEAQTKCDEVNLHLEPPHHFIPVNFPGMGWACMLSSAYYELKKMGILT